MMHCTRIIVGFLDTLATCVCGHEFSKNENLCPKCGKVKFSILKLDSSHGTKTKTVKKSKFSLPNLCNDIIDDFCKIK